MAALTQRSLIVAITAGALVVVFGYFAYDRLRPPCDAIFEQTATRVDAKLSLIKSADAEVLIGREKVQELSQSAQKLALNLKACCVACGGNLNVADFLRCKSDGDQQEERLERLAEALKAAQHAKEQAKPEIVRKQVTAAGTLVDEVRAGAAEQDQQVKRLADRDSPPKPPLGGAGTDIFNPKIIKSGSTTTSEITAAQKEVWFRFTADTPVRDWMDIRIENQAAALVPCVAVYDSNRSQIGDTVCASNASASVERAFVAAPGKDYLVDVSSHWGQTAGTYALSVTPRKAYDAYEPNNDIFSAKPIAAGKLIDANIMDGNESDWFLVKSFPGKQLIMRADNRSAALQPCVALYDSNRSQIGDTVCASNASANVELTRAVEAGRDYYIVVSAHWGQSAGDYRLMVAEGHQ
jgi:hypothetical protein